MAEQKLLKNMAPYFFEGVRIALIMSSGDIITQKFIEKRQYSNLDWKRTLKFGCVGLVVVGPILNHWVKVMERIVPKKDMPLVRGFKKMAIDQFMFAPVFNIVVIGAFAFLNGETLNDFKERLRKGYINLMLTSYMVWPAIQMLNFSVVPLQYQVPFSQFCGIFWNCYLSYVLNRKS